MSAIRTFIFLILIILNAGCGFRPLYYVDGTNQYITAVPQLNVIRIPDRNGQIVRNRLQQLLGARISKSASIILEVMPIQIVTHSTSVRRDGTTARYRLSARTTISLKDSVNQKTIYEDNVVAINAYSIGECSATAAYSTLIAAQDAKDKALLQMADQITALVISFYQNVKK